MPMNGVCDLELRQLIEGALLPLKSEVTCFDGTLTIHFPADNGMGEQTVTGFKVDTLPSARAIADLVGQIREERLTMGLQPRQLNRA